MEEDYKSNNKNLKEIIKDTQMLIRNTMLNHKKSSKRLHTTIKKDKKTIDLFKEKIAKLSIEKEKLELKVTAKLDADRSEGSNIKSLTHQILKELEEKKQLEEKIIEMKEDYYLIKGEMGGLNATERVKEKYEKHIKILENRLDKANQKFNEAIEKDKFLREEIDQLRKERFFFEK
jgi:chromosome segregation ATPase